MWHVAYDKVALSHYCCSRCILTHWYYKLKEAEARVKCRKQLILVLLYADIDDTVILAEDEKLMRRGLEVLMEWCDEWSMEVNVEKSGIMHMRRKAMKRACGEVLCWW